MNFASDNTAGIAPPILEAIVRANAGVAAGYGADDLTEAVERVPGVESPGDQPLGPVIVVIPTYNYRKYVVEAIESVLAQSYQPLEVIERDSDRDYYLEAKQAVEYGLVDQVLEMPEKVK